MFDEFEDLVFEFAHPMGKTGIRRGESECVQGAVNGQIAKLAL